MLKAILILIASYILGSIPFGYLITKYSTNKNLLEIGWKKNSGSNVMKNVGKAQGIFTFVFDVAKGALAVYLAQYFGFFTIHNIFNFPSNRKKMGNSFAPSYNFSFIFYIFKQIQNWRSIYWIASFFTLLFFPATNN